MTSKLTVTDISALSRLLDELLALDAADRPAWLAALAPTEQHLVPVLRDMLAEHEGARAPTLQAELPVLGADPNGRSDASTPMPDERVGPYRLLRQIGQGGMGSVWLAERADGALTRQVALKLPRLAWDAGLAARMARERDIAALLEHPNIARLYDAGVDAQGRPFLALEFIDGQPIDAWCAVRALGVAARLRLFVQVAHAVAYAHGRLVIHRDLKPANVLVSADGQAHLLDFGIARRLHGDESGGPGQTSQTPQKLQMQQTQELHRALTPHYASPEQISGEPLTVQSDVYSLGVLLYELLTGASPISPKRASPGAVEEAILLGDAPLASTRALNRDAAKTLRGDLDAILAQSMQREPARRYATADALTQDIERHLAGHTVQAQPDGALYRLRKALRRHWLGVSAALAVLIAVLVGGALAVVQAQRAERATQRERLVKDFITELFKINERGSPVNKDLRAVPAELLLERGAGLIESRFAGQADLQAELYGVVAQIMLNMGAAKSAAAYAGKQVYALEAAAATSAQQAAGAALLGEALSDAGRFEDAKRSAMAAAALAKGDTSLAVRSGLLLADLLTKRSQPSAALDELNRLERVGLLNETRPLLEQARGNLLRATALNALDRFQEAAPLLRKAINQAEASESGPSRLAANARIQLADGLVLQLTGDDVVRIRALGPNAVSAAAEAMQLHRAAFAILNSSGGIDTIAAAGALSYATFLYAGNGMVGDDEADAAYARSLATVDALGPRLPSLIRAKILIHRGCTAYLFGRVQSGYDWMAESLALRRAEFPATTASACLGFAAAATGRHAEAERILAAVVDKEAKDTAAAQGNVIRAWARNRMMQGNFKGATDALSSLVTRYGVHSAGAVEQEGEAHSLQVTLAWIDLERHAYGAVLQRLSGLPVTADENLLADGALVLGAALCGLGKHQEGGAMMAASLGNHAKTQFPHSPALAYWRARLGQCALGGSEPVRAHGLAKQARAAFTGQAGVAPFFKTPLRELEAALALKLPPRVKIVVAPIEPHQQGAK